MYQRPHEKLVTWQEAYRLALFVYTITRTFPTEERYCLVSQMRRAGYSVPMNIAEGNAKRTPKEKRKFFDISKGSLEELHCQGRLAMDLGYITVHQFQELDDRIQRVSFLLSKLRTSTHSQTESYWRSSHASHSSQSVP